MVIIICQLDWFIHSNAYCISKAISIYYFILYVHEIDDWNFTLFQNIVFVSAGRQWHCDAQCWLMIQLERRTNFWDDIEHFIYNIIQCSCAVHSEIESKQNYNRLPVSCYLFLSLCRNCLRKSIDVHSATVQSSSVRWSLIAVCGTRPAGSWYR